MELGLLLANSHKFEVAVTFIASATSVFFSTTSGLLSAAQ